MQLSGFEGKSALIVEDDPDLRAILAEIFKWNGFRVFQCTNGKEACTLLQADSKQPFMDVVVTDLKMHGGDGVRLVQHICGLQGKRPLVYVMTGQSELQNDARLAEGTRGLYVKPFDVLALLDAIRRDLEALAE